MEKLLAKSDGTTLLDHSKLVSKLAVAIIKNSGVTDENLIESVRLAGLLHDIGKCTAYFQNKLNKGLEPESIKDTKLKFAHNEIGWAFVSQRFSVNKEIDRLVLDSVYWHHGIYNRMSASTNNEVIGSIIKDSCENIKVMENFLLEVVSDEYIKIENIFNTKTTPKFYLPTTTDDHEEINAKQMIVRSCLISADRIVSKLGKQDLTDIEIHDVVKTLQLPKDLDIKNHKFYGNERFIFQESVVKEIRKTSIIKAPAGFGKTLLGLLWMISKGEQICWVCPRNVVAESVYESIIGELNNFGFTDLSAELYLSGDIVKSTHSSNGFSSHIIVTNADNYLKPSVDNRHADKLSQILNINVVFDEWDELISNSALFACFINIMRVRNNITKSNTLLLSATPLPINGLWDMGTNKTTILPNEKYHYPATHKTPFKLNIISDFTGIKPNNNTLVVYNSISNSQLNKEKSDELIHSSFNDIDRKRVFDSIFDKYKKTEKRTLGLNNVVSTSVIQASVDISFHHVYESVLSHQATFQRLGRNNRFDDYKDLGTPSLNICYLNDASENKVRNIFFTKDLTNIWLEFISKYDGKLLTLDEAYILYNDFTETYTKTLVNFISSKYRESMDNLIKIYPTKIYTSKVNKSKDSVITIGGNKLRGTSSDIFVIAKNYGLDTFCDAFSVQIYEDIDKQFDEHNPYDNGKSGSYVTGKVMHASMVSIRNQNDGRFDYNDLINEKTKSLDDFRRAAKKSNTPYIRYDGQYHPIYGFIKNKVINKINL